MVNRNVSLEDLYQLIRANSDIQLSLKTLLGLLRSLNNFGERQVNYNQYYNN